MYANGKRSFFPEQESNLTLITTEKIAYCTHDSVWNVLFIAKLTIGYNYWYDVYSRSVKTMHTNVFAKKL